MSGDCDSNRLLDSLSSEQEKVVPEFIRAWSEVEVDTEPAEREEAERIMSERYLSLGLKVPQFFWSGSPLSMALARVLYLMYDMHRSGSLTPNCLNRYLALNLKSLNYPSSGEQFSVDLTYSPLGKCLKTDIRDGPFNACNRRIAAAISNKLKYQIWSNQIDVHSFSPFFNFALHPESTSQVQMERQRTWITQTISNAQAIVLRTWNSIPESVWDNAWQSPQLAFGSADKEIRNTIQEALIYQDACLAKGSRMGLIPVAAIFDMLRDCAFGQHDARLLVVPSFLRSICGLREETEELKNLIEHATYAGWILPHADVCWMSERQCRVSLDSIGRPHSANGPAIEFPDGWKIYSWHGVTVDERIIERPHEITSEEIDSEKNIEIRHILIERFGPDRYIQTGMEILDDDPAFGTLYRKPMGGRETLVMVRVRNSSPEPDGTFKDYFIRVPPDMFTAREAVAWTFGLSAREYKPMIET